MPMMGLRPASAAACQNSITPYITPWSVSASAGCPSSLARATICGMRARPSSSEYSEWQWRWTKDMGQGAEGRRQWAGGSEQSPEVNNEVGDTREETGGVIALLRRDASLKSFAQT